jgi:hypothetical protein
LNPGWRVKLKHGRFKPNSVEGEPVWKCFAKKRRKKLKVIMEMLPEECRFEVLKFAFNASYRDIICLYNDINRGCPVNLQWRTTYLKERTQTLDYRVPEITMALFYDQCRKLNLDPYETFVKLLNRIVSENKLEYLNV